MKFKSVILAAGLGTRMKSELPKVMHEVLGKPMVAYPIEASFAVGAEEVAVVAGYRRELVENYVMTTFAGKNVSTHVQEKMIGTADAVRSAHLAFDDYDGHIMILCGDVPNVPVSDLRHLVELHAAGNSPLSFVTAHDYTPNEYGKIVRDAAGKPTRIVEHKDATAEEKTITEVNIGLYIVEAAFLREALGRMNSNNAQGEFYLTDIVAMAYDRGQPANIFVAPEIEALHGVNDRTQLARAEEFAKLKLQA